MLVLVMLGPLGHTRCYSPLDYPSHPRFQVDIELPNGISEGQVQVHWIAHDGHHSPQITHYCLLTIGPSPLERAHRACSE